MGIMELLGLFVFCLGMTVSFPYSTAGNSEVSKKLTVEGVKRLSSENDKDAFHALLKPLLIERVSDTKGNEEAREYIIGKLKELSWHISEDAFTDNTPYGEKKFVNIVATMHPHVNKRLTIACHYDSKYFKEFKFIGATDSAVPCAMMLSMAKSLNSFLWKSPGGKHKDTSLQFIFFDGEEAFKHWTATDSLYGARHLANKMAGQKLNRESSRTELDAMNVLVLLDLIGAPDAQFHSFFRETDHLFKRLQNIENHLQDQKLLTTIPQNSKKTYFMGTTYMHNIEDDHIPFLRKGVPVLHLISLPFPKVWHKADDNEENLDMDSILDLNLVMKIFVAEYMHLDIN